MLKRGDKYQRLKPVHVIYLLHNTYFHEAPDTYHFRFRPREVQNLAEIHSMMTVHFVEIAKASRLVKRGNGQANEEGLNPWLQFLHNPDDQSLNEVMTHMPELNETKKKFERLRRDPQAREIARLRAKALSDYNTAIDVARKEGRQEGRQENIEATLRRLLSSPKYADMTDADIAEIAGTDVARVATIRKLVAAGG